VSFCINIFPHQTIESEVNVFIPHIFSSQVFFTLNKGTTKKSIVGSVVMVEKVTPVIALGVLYKTSEITNFAPAHKVVTSQIIK
jgi:hypothetical protein